MIADLFSLVRVPARYVDQLKEASCQCGIFGGVCVFTKLINASHLRRSLC